MAETTKINISDKEKEILRSYSRTTPLVLIRLKAQAVLMAHNGLASAPIGDVVGRSAYTVGQWLKDWRRSGLSSIFTGHQDNNNAGKLTSEQREEIQQTLQSPPSDFGLPKEFWDVPQLKAYVTTQFDIIYEGNDSYHFLLKFGNLGFKYPNTFDLRRDDAAIAERMTAIRAELAPLLASDDWEVFSSDEVRMDQEAITRRAWITKGKKTIVKVNRQRESQSYIGFLNQKTGHCETFEMPWQNSAEVLKACEQLLHTHPTKKIAIVWDNAAFHRSKAIQEALRAGNLLERVHLIAMPPYAPDHNPIEHVWGVTKQAISNIQYPRFSDTNEAFTGFIRGRTFEFVF